MHDACKRACTHTHDERLFKIQQDARNPPITCKTNHNHAQRRRLIASARRGGALMRSGATSSTHNNVTGITRQPDRQRREQRGRPWRHRPFIYFFSLSLFLFFGRRLTPAMYSASALCIVKLLGNSSGACFVYLCCDY